MKLALDSPIRRSARSGTRSPLSLFHPPLGVRTVPLRSGWRIRPAPVPDPLEADPPTLPSGSEAPTVSLPFAWQTLPGWHEFQGPVDLDLRFPDPPWQDRTDLVCEGLFYASEWDLNGVRLGHHEGYIAPFRREVTDLLGTGVKAQREAHHLHIRLSCPPEPEHLHKHLMTGIFSHWDCLPETYNPGGIWRMVRLERHRSIRIEGLWLRTGELGPDLARTEVMGQLSVDRSGLYVIRARLRPLPGFPRRPDGRTTITAHLNQGTTALRIPLTVPDPMPWQPREWLSPSGSKPTLYELRVEVSRVTGPPSGIPATPPPLPYRITRHVGIRTVERLHTGQLRVNGRALFVRGMNYAPSTAYLADASPGRCWKDVRDVLDTGLNALRVHAHLDRPALYRAADRLGLLLFQDGPLQWMYDPAALAQAPAHLSALLDRVMAHPSVCYIAVHNEPVAVANPAEKGIGPRLRALSSVFLWSENRDLWDRAIARDLRRKVRGHLVISSQSGVLPRLPGADVHLYMGWYADFGPLPNLDRLRRLAPWTLAWVTEFGAQSLPCEVTSRRFVPEHPTVADWDRLARTHMAQPGRLEEHVGIVGYSREEAIQRTQAYQAALDAVYIDRLRAYKYAPVAGFFAFVWADATEGITWSHLDAMRVPKRAALTLPDTLRPVTVVALLPLSPPSGRRAVPVPLWVVNDTAWPLHLRVVVEVTEGSHPGRHGQAPDRVLEADVTPDGRASLGTLFLNAQTLTKPHVLRIGWRAVPTGPAAWPSSPIPPAHGERTYALPSAAWGKDWILVPTRDEEKRQEAD